AAFALPLQLAATILPSFIVGVGVADAVHIMNAYYRHLQETADPRSAFIRALDETARPVLMTTITTAVGLFSLSLVQIKALTNFGWIAGLSTIAACIFTVIFAALLLAASRHAPRSSAPILLGKQMYINRLANGVVAVSGRHAGKIILATMLAGAFSLLALPGLKLSHDALDWVPQNWTEVYGMDLIDRHFGSASAFEIVIDSGEANGVLDPQFIASLRQLCDSIERPELRHIFSSSRSIDGYLQETSKAMD